MRGHRITGDPVPAEAGICLVPSCLLDEGPGDGALSGFGNCYMTFWARRVTVLGPAGIGGYTALN